MAFIGEELVTQSTMGQMEKSLALGQAGQCVCLPGPLLGSDTAS